jgi:hypothetical protein
VAQVVLQPLLVQAYGEQFVEVATPQVPLEQVWAEVKLLPEQEAVAQVVQAAPPLPQAEADVPATQVLPLQQPLGQLVESQVQVPLTQCWPLLQVCPQAPQLLLSDCVLTQLVPHLVNPLVHTKPQVLLLQVALPFGGAGQTAKHLPQLFGSVWMLTHFVPQSLVPIGH